MSADGDFKRQQAEDKRVRAEYNLAEAAARREDGRRKEDPVIVAQADEFDTAAQQLLTEINDLLEEAAAADQAEADAMLKEAEHHKRLAEEILLEETLRNS
jgi:uncharacterized protein YlxW (UPF0749 family)